PTAELATQGMTVVHARVGGQVQGVGFRWFVREVARRHGLSGWVKNLDDGSVELAVQGDSASVERFLEEVERGPRGARVEYLRHLPAENLGPLEPPFTIVR
ncbi:MAG: acylphosphatase, partial [Gemmatimonadaceae bacterium]